MIAGRIARAGAVVAAALVLTGCSIFIPTPEAPMKTVVYEHRPAAEARGLVVLLPGVFDDPEVFNEEGFVAALRDVDPRLNAVAVDAHLGYYKGKHNNIVERLRDDVVLPARRAGYREVWLAGVSLGGFGSLLYASRYPDHVTGIIALAPYPGPDDIAEEVSNAGGLSRWQPGNLATLPGEDRFFREVWRWTKGYAAGASRPPLFLGYGADDDFAPANRLLADSLEANQVMVDPEGGHDWETWRGLFVTLARRALSPPDA